MKLLTKIKKAFKSPKFSKGSTLAELVIVLAVASIISTAVVSYAVMFNKRVKNHNEKLNLMQDMSIAQVFVENWIDDLVKENPTLENVKCEIKDGVLQSGKVDGDNFVVEKSVAVKSFSEINLSFIQNGEDYEDYLYYCTLTHGSEKYVFTVNPRVGESTTPLQGGGQ